MAQRGSNEEAAEQEPEEVRFTRITAYAQGIGRNVPLDYSSLRRISAGEPGEPLESPAAVVRHVKKNGTPSIVWREGMYYAANLYMENEWMVDDGCMDVLISLKLQFQLKQGIISVHEILPDYTAPEDVQVGDELLAIENACFHPQLQCQPTAETLNDVSRTILGAFMAGLPCTCIFFRRQPGESEPEREALSLPEPEAPAAKPPTGLVAQPGKSIETMLKETRLGILKQFLEEWQERAKTEEYPERIAELDSSSLFGDILLKSGPKRVWQILYDRFSAPEGLPSS